MTNGILPHPRQDAPRALPSRAAPKGVAIICTYLIGMTAIGAGALAMRAPVLPPPAIGADMISALPRPQTETGAAPGAGHFGNDARPDARAPRLAALSAAHTRLRDDLASPLSRIFLGRPAAVPPARPDPSAAGQPGDSAHDSRRASLRPQARPADLAIARSTPEPQPDAEPAIENIRLASLVAPEAPQPEASALPATPRIASGSGTCPGQLARAMPRRPGNAADAQTVLASVEGVDGVKRDAVVANEILRGNLPGFLHDLAPVTVSGQAGDGKPVAITLCVTPDYLAVGSDRDYVRVPLGLRAATRIGDAFDMILPTPRMVDLIYRAADLQLAPQPMPPGPQMTSTAYFVRHNATVEAQRRRAGAAPGTLISGQKKDVVLTTRLASHRGRVAIYGWHRTNGQPIQPLSTVHGAGYADYSHGVRLVSRTAYLDGKPVDLRSLMADPRYAGLLSKEGPLTGPALRMAALAAN